MSNSPMQSSNMTSEEVYDTQSISTQTLPDSLFRYQYYSERRHENNEIYQKIIQRKIR